tara:strand:- start:7459 stop:8547 length:1089 start_codon:yes stop_codon:yes gene_type:complete
MIFISTRTSVFHAIGGMELYIKQILNSLKNEEKIVLLDKYGIYEINLNGEKKIKKSFFKISEKNTKFDFMLCIIRTLIFLIRERKNFKNFFFFGHSGMLALLFLNEIREFSKVFYLGFEFLILKDLKKNKFNLHYFHYLLSKISCSYASSIMLIEKSQEALVLKSFHVNNKKLQVLNNFVSIDKKYSLSNKPNSKSLNFLSIGRDCISKDREKLIELWPMLHKNLTESNFDINLKIICPNPSKKLINIVNDLKNLNVEMKTDLSYGQLNKIRAESQYEISLSIQEIPLLSILESMYFGVIPVVNNNHGRFFDDTNSISIHNFRDVANNSDKVKSLRINVKNIAEQRNPENFKKDLKKIINYA